ncbi:MAG: MarR family transcriptional regulator [Phycisphaeraceae bacterium]|nr:MarR family transcriptional regulator [Phycisphaeraceae bacterium]
MSTHPSSPRPEPRGLAREIGKQRPFDSPQQETHLNLLRTVSVVTAPFDALFRAHGLSESSYNALRILRAAGTRGRLCREIGEHLVSRVPDVTRLLDRLASAGLVRRVRGAEDRRRVHVSITPAGLALLARLDRPIAAAHRAQFPALGPARLRTLNRLLEAARRPAQVGATPPAKRTRRSTP